MKGKQTLNTLKDYARYRILDEVIQSANEGTGNPLGYYILVMDKKATKVLASICKMFDLLSYKISTIESIDLPRKRYTSSDAIYLVSPTEAAIDAIIKDFSDPANPQYKFAHLCFLEMLSEPLFAKISSCPALVTRIKSLKELNINFYIWSSEVFVLGLEPRMNPILSADSKDYIE